MDQYSIGSSPYGCVDMVGNVWEWCADSRGSYRVNRGGSWLYAVDCRSALRGSDAPRDRNIYLGFRLAFSSVDQSGQ